MKHHRPTLQEKEDDLQTLTAVIGLLANASDAIGAANAVLVHAKAMSQSINDPTIRRQCLKAAGLFKATCDGFHKEKRHHAAHVPPAAA
jgi:hypothetical protein